MAKLNVFTYIGASGFKDKFSLTVITSTVSRIEVNSLPISEVSPEKNVRILMIFSVTETLFVLCSELTHLIFRHYVTNNVCVILKWRCLLSVPLREEK